MSDFIERDQAENDLLACAAFVAERIKSADGHAASVSDAALRYAARAELDLAAGLADTIVDPHVRDQILSEVAAFCAEYNDDEYGFQLVEAMEEANLQQHALHHIAVRQAAQNRFDDALATIEKIDVPDVTNGDAAIRLAAAGDETGARAILAQITQSGVRAQVLHGIAVARQNRQESFLDVLNEFLAETRTVEFAEERTQLLLDAAAEFIAAAEPATATAVLNEVRQLAETLEPQFRDQSLAHTAALFARANDFAAAESALEPIINLEQTAVARLAFADEHFARQDTAQAISSLEEALALIKAQTARFISSKSSSQFDLWATIAVRFARFGKSERALEVALENPNESSRTAALTNFAVWCAAHNRPELARQATNEIETLADRVFALLAISRRSGKDDEENAIRVLHEAHDLSEEVEQLNLRSEALSEIVEQFAELGDRQRAAEVAAENLRVVASLNNKTQQVVLLGRIAEIFDKSNLELNEEMQQSLKQIVRKSLL